MQIHKLIILAALVYLTVSAVGQTCNLQYCGNGYCDQGETQTTCPVDCGAWCLSSYNCPVGQFCGFDRVCHQKRANGQPCGMPVTPEAYGVTCQSGNCVEKLGRICRPVFCGNGVCDVLMTPEETKETCPEDCTLPIRDSDLDGINDNDDNAPYVYNPDQADADRDGIGDVIDNDPMVPNPDQADVSNKADLYVESVAFGSRMPQTGSNVTDIIINVKNRGGKDVMKSVRSGKSAGFNVLLYIDEQLIGLSVCPGTGCVGGFGPGETLNITIPVDLRQYKLSAGEHRLKVGVDIGDNIDEAEKENNKRTIVLVIESCKDINMRLSNLKWGSPIVETFSGGEARVRYNYSFSYTYSKNPLENANPDNKDVLVLSPFLKVRSTIKPLLHDLVGCDMKSVGFGVYGVEGEATEVEEYLSPDYSTKAFLYAVVSGWSEIRFYPKRYGEYTRRLEVGCYNGDGSLDVSNTDNVLIRSYYSIKDIENARIPILSADIKFDVDKYCEDYVSKGISLRIGPSAGFSKFHVCSSVVKNFIKTYGLDRLPTKEERFDYLLYVISAWSGEAGFQYVSRDILARRNPWDQKGSEFLITTKGGECFDFSMALFDISRTLGFSEDEIYVVFLLPNFFSSGGGHAMNVVYVDGKWRLIDPQAGFIAPYNLEGKYLEYTAELWNDQHGKFKEGTCQDIICGLTPLGGTK